MWKDNLTIAQKHDMLNYHVDEKVLPWKTTLILP